MEHSRYTREESISDIFVLVDELFQPDEEYKDKNAPSHQDTNRVITPTKTHLAEEDIEERSTSSSSIDKTQADSPIKEEPISFKKATLTSLAIYLNEALKVREIRDRKTAHELAKKASQGDTLARNDLVEGHLRPPIKVATYIWKESNSLIEDLT